MPTLKAITVEYHALLREERGLSTEAVSTAATTAGDLYRELRANNHFSLEPERLKVAVNDVLATWNTVIHSGDKVVFIPPVAGG